MQDKKNNVDTLPRKPILLIYKSQDKIIAERIKKREQVLNTYLQRRPN